MCIASRARLIGGVPSSEPPMNRRKAPEKKAPRGSRLSGVALHVMRDAQSSSGAFVPGGRSLPPRVAHARKGHWRGCLAAAPEEQVRPGCRCDRCVSSTSTSRRPQRCSAAATAASSAAAATHARRLRELLQLFVCSAQLRRGVRGAAVCAAVSSREMMRLRDRSRRWRSWSGRWP